MSYTQPLVAEPGRPAAQSELTLCELAQPGLVLRCVTGSDIPGISTMWDRCSPATRTDRFFAPVRHIPVSYLEAALSDLGAHVLAVRGPAGDVVALASLIASPGSATAELGVLVEDAWQRRGIGRRLVARLIRAAPARGINTLTASILARNARVADLLRQVPGQFSIASDGDVLMARVRLASVREATYICKLQEDECRHGAARRSSGAGWRPNYAATGRARR